MALHGDALPAPEPFDELSSVRVSLPSRHVDPKIGVDLYNRYLEEYITAAEAGLDLMVNEHHQAATCIDVTAPLSLAILARQTKRARLCILCNPIAESGVQRRWPSAAILAQNSSASSMRSALACN